MNKPLETLKKDKKIDLNKAVQFKVAKMEKILNFFC